MSALRLPVLSLLLVASLASGPLAAESAAHPNIVLFLVDDMGWVDCGAYGSTFYETPNIDRLAKAGMLFTDAYSANPLCSPTRASILSGKYPARLGLTSAVGHQPPLPPETPLLPTTAPSGRPIITPESRRFLDPSEYTLAEALRDAGYTTGHFGKWHLGLTEEYWPEQQGYDVAFHGHPDPGPPGPNGYFSPYSYKTGTITPGKPGEYIVDRITDEVLHFIENRNGKPFFASVWQCGVHGPWDFKEEYVQHYVDKQDPRGLQSNPVMGAMLQSIDESVGRIVARLDELGLTRDTIFLFTSDNGGNTHSNSEEERTRKSPGDDAPLSRQTAQYIKYADHQVPTNNTPLRDGKGTLYEGGYRVPLIVSWPGHVAAGAKNSTVACSIDFYPTLLDLAGVPANGKQTFDGRSLAPVLRGETGTIDREAVFNFFPHGGPSKPSGATVRKGDWKLIRWFETGPKHPQLHELYDLAGDLGETTNLAEQQPELVAELDRLIDRFFEETGAVIPIPNPDYRPDETSEKTSTEPPALAWQPKNCDAELGPESLKVFPTTRAPFLGKNGLKGAGSLELRVRLKTPAGGTGHIQWRTKDQDNFAKEGQTVEYEVSPGNEWQEAVIPFTTSEQLAHLRFYLPSTPGPFEVGQIELRDAGVKPRSIGRWEFKADAAK